jgi:arylsulfate sulfotransferase
MFEDVHMYRTLPLLFLLSFILLPSCADDVSNSSADDVVDTGDRVDTGSGDVGEDGGELVSDAGPVDASDAADQADADDAESDAETGAEADATLDGSDGGVSDTAADADADTSDLDATDRDADAVTADADTSTSDADADAEVSDDSSDSEDADGDTTDAADAGEDVAPTPAILSFEVLANPNITIAAVATVVTSEPAAVSSRVELDGAPLFTTNQTLGLTEHVIDVVGMRAETMYSLIPLLNTGEGVVEGSPTEFTTGALPDYFEEGLFEVEVSEGYAGSGYTLVGISLAGSVVYFVVDSEGYVVWYVTGSRPGRVGFAEQLPDGSFFGPIDDGYAAVDIGGSRVFSAVPPVDETYHHDALLLPNGNILGLIRRPITLFIALFDLERTLDYDVVAEVTPEGEIIAEWSTLDHIDTERFPSLLSGAVLTPGAADWTHANALVYDPSDDTFLISVRHHHWIMKVSRATGDVIWRLGPDGDFELSDGEWFYAPHSPEIQSDGSILLFDNGNERPVDEPYSRAVRYELDELTMTARQVWDHRTDTYSRSMGDADALPHGGHLICAWENDAGSSVVYELDNDGSQVWWLRSDAGRIYRGTRFETFYP